MNVKLLKWKKSGSGGQATGYLNCFNIDVDKIKGCWRAWIYESNGSPSEFLGAFISKSDAVFACDQRNEKDIMEAKKELAKWEEE